MSDAAPILIPAEKREKPQKRRLFSRGFVYCVLGIFVLFLIAIAPSGGLRQARHNAAMHQAHQIGQCMFAYSTDNNGAYPDGNSSTAVFQKLIDGGYVTDPAIFYVPLRGKVKAVGGQKLKPENVCWDVTSGVDSSSSDLVPLVFMTGYRITYAPGGSALSVIKPYPPFWREPRTWSEWWNGAPDPDSGPSGIAICYKGNNAVFIRLGPDNTVQAIVSPDFKPDGKTYRQLTPDGPLAQ